MAKDKALEYEYTELKNDLIRIAHLKPGDGEGSIYVELSVENINDMSQDYSALSWKWGDEDEDSVIRIRDKPVNQGTDNQVNGNQRAGGQKPTEWLWMRVKPNLWDALRRLRNPDDEVRLWIDAICIKQVQERGNSNSEKSRQISMMTDIFKKAGAVKVWLGEPKPYKKEGIADDNITPEDVKTAMRYVDLLENLDDTNHIAGVDQGILEKAGMHDLEPLFKLLRRGWFSRRWIVQEISVNRNVQVHCGEEAVSWKKLAHAVALLERVGRDGTINRMLQKRPETRHVAEYVGNISALPAYRLVQNKHTLSRLRGGEEIREQTLEQLVCFLAVFQASYAHDTIYAILGIASDFRPVTGRIENMNDDEWKGDGQKGNQKGGGKSGDKIPKIQDFVVDYEQEPLQVFKRFLKYAIRRSRSLDILCRPWAPIMDIGKDDKLYRITLPSWMPNIERKPFQATKGGRMVRYNSDPLVGAAVFRLKFYSASGLGDPRIDDFFEISMDKNSRHIVVHAFELSKIGQVWDSAAFGNIPKSWLGAGGWKEGEGQPPDELWRTLVADRTHEGNKADPWYPMAFQSAVREKGARYGINTAELIHEKNNAAYSEVFRRVQAVVWDRRLIRTEGITPDGKGEGWSHLGLAPEEAQEGDSIFIVLGCSVPLVLRPRPNPGNGTSSQPAGIQNGINGQHANPQEHVRTYTLIGDCYIDDMMDGQALAHQVGDWEKIKIE
ncbi:heterokaryon incompatibility protein-domain-containing protein [Hypoxylon cercidicola]|nr:heterokaryon incompatibility protein-domain-containing protein [Hypoxylon cercidicola]